MQLYKTRLFSKTELTSPNTIKGKILIKTTNKNQTIELIKKHIKNCSKIIIEPLEVKWNAKSATQKYQQINKYV